MKCVICGKEAKGKICFICQLEENEYATEEKRLLKPKPQSFKTKKDLSEDE